MYQDKNINLRLKAKTFQYREKTNKKSCLLIKGTLKLFLAYQNICGPNE